MSRPPAGIPGSEMPPPLLRQRWQTINPAHAVQQVAAVVTFPEELPSFLIGRAVDAIRPIARRLGMVKEDPVNAVTMQVGPGGIKSSPQSVTGTSFQDIQGGQPLQVLNITRDSVRYQVQNYTRWQVFREALSSLLGGIMPVVSSATPIKTIDLEYVDFFVAVAEGAEDAGLVLDNNPNWVARRAFRKRDPFHSHTGWFETGHSESHRLVNVDVTVSDALGPIGVRRAITIRTYESEQMLNVQGQLAQEMSDPQRLLQTFEELHVSLKGRVSHVLTRDAKNMISLGG